MMAILLLVGTLLMGCGRPQVEARRTFNEGVSALSSGDADAAAEKLLSARDSAGTDDALRRRAAYDLGLAWVAKVEKAESPDDKLSDLRQSAAWFRDAVRLDPKDDDARANLEIVLHRATALADQMNQDQSRLEGRLKGVIEDARALRDGVRQLLGQLDAGGAQADPQAFQDSFDSLAKQDRALSAQVGTVLDLAGDELDGLSQKADDDLSDKEKAREYQLNALQTWVNSARTSLTSGRADLRELDARGAHTQSSRALQELKRAAEQLSDPIHVLQAVTRDEATLRQKTAVLMQAGALSIGDGATDGDKQVPKLPSWFSAESLDEEQGTIADRAGEVATRLDAASQAAAAQDQSSQDQTSQDEQQKRLLALASEAAPFVHAGVDHMAQARQALVSGSVGQAIPPETEALSSLSDALERFSDLRTLVDLAWNTQDQLTTLMDPSQGDASLSAADRMQAVAEGISRNRSRLDRLAPLIEDDRIKAQAAAEKAQADDADDADDVDGAGDTGHAQAKDPGVARAEQAELLRGQTASALELVDQRIQDGTGDPLIPARDALDDLDQLRQLYFSLVDHLKKLISDESENHDQTAAVAAEDYDQMLAALDPMIQAEQQHKAMADAITKALRAQADAASSQGDASAQGAQPQASQGPSSDDLAEAALDVDLASDAMDQATSTLTDARDETGGMSHDIEPAIDDQADAIDQLSQALQLLQPPKKQQGDKDKDKDKDKQKQQDQDVSRQQAERRLQEAREREAERKRKPASAGNEPVDKDW